MALITDNSVFLHCPKTAGYFVRKAFKDCKIPHFEIAGEHDHFPYLYKFKPKNFWKNKFIFTFVRHPLSWYQSRWAFRVKHGWKAGHILDFHCASNDFEVFCNNVIAYKPTGWVTWEYSMYIDQCPKPCDFIGKTENVVEDTITAFRLAGEKFSERIIRSIGIINDSNLDGKPSSYWATYSDELRNKILTVEADVVNKYYKSQ